MTDTTYGTYDPADRPGRKATTPEPSAPLKGADGTDLPSFDQGYAEPFKGLTYLGALTKEFSWLGHTFVIRTLGLDDQLAIAQVAAKYKDGGEQLAYTTAVVAMCVDSVDGESLPSPYGEDQDLAEWAHRRFGYVKANWYQPTINRVWQEYLELEDKVAEVVEAMGKAFGPAA
ncbi:hypothetical protein [Streptomyces sp. MH60]|uniref:hypothetical protein n=1 Tax=Streptomyces sp. MH60 TaxID=1940758 RepID=UPI000CEEB4E0|nr:hypothetical protein [Streptomyces sp. MH60]PPS89479.1 hypothetical protein BZZ08_01625 [Streptomyces sp. MH60]